MINEILNKLDSYRDEMIETLAASVKINSVAADPVRVRRSQTADEQDNTVLLPYGKGVDDAYEHMLNVGKSLGFETFDANRYGGHLEWKVPGATETFGIAAHLDVVPEGTGWDHDPYGAEIVDGRMIGRGTTDDKGPLVAALYAMKALKESGAEPNVNIRVILGLDEETGMAGMANYLEAAGKPDFGVTPDADFPLINGEKGALNFDLVQKLHKQTSKDGLILRRVEGGTAHNAVPASAKAVVASEDQAAYDSIKEKADAFSRQTGHKLIVKKAGSSLSIEAIGVAAHAAHPELGTNAVSILLEFLGTLTFAGGEVNDFIDFYNEHIAFNLNGEKIGCEFSDEPSGKLTFNIGIAEFTEEAASVTVDIRFPVTCSAEEVLAGIEAHLENTNIGIVKHGGCNPIYIDANDDFAQNLLSAYREETGDLENGPIVIGGGTYAKSFDRMLAFGCAFPGDEDRMHQANESIDLEQFMKAARVYARMLYKVCCVQGK